MAIVIGSGITVGSGILIGDVESLPVFFVTEINENYIVTENDDNIIEEQFV